MAGSCSVVVVSYFTARGSTFSGMRARYPQAANRPREVGSQETAVWFPPALTSQLRILVLLSFLLEVS